METTYTDDGVKFYTMRLHSFWQDTVVLTDTHTGFEVNMSHALFRAKFRIAPERATDCDRFTVEGR